MLNEAAFRTLREIPEKVLKTLRSYAAETAGLFPGSRIILFGSYAKGSFHEESDIDIALFLPDAYRSRDPVKIFRELYRLSGRYDCDIQPQVFFDEEFQNPAGIVEEIIEFGIDISVPEA